MLSLQVNLEAATYRLTKAIGRFKIWIKWPMHVLAWVPTPPAAMDLDLDSSLARARSSMALANFVDES